MVFDGIVSSEIYLKNTCPKRVWKCRSICFYVFYVHRREVFTPIRSKASYSPLDLTDYAIYFIFLWYLSRHCLPDLPTTLYLCFINVLTNGQFFKPTSSTICMTASSSYDKQRLYASGPRSSGLLHKCKSIIISKV